MPYNYSKTLGCSRAWTEVDGVHSLLCMKSSIMYVLYNYVCDPEDIWRPPTSYGVHALLFLGLHPCQWPCHQRLVFTASCNNWNSND